MPLFLTYNNLFTLLVIIIIIIIIFSSCRIFLFWHTYFILPNYLNPILHQNIAHIFPTLDYSTPQNQIEFVTLLLSFSLIISIMWLPN